MKRVRINGVEEEISATTVGELLAARGVDPAAKFLAIAINGCVVRRSQWPATRLGPGDDIEIVRPFSGG
jgi:sulfur carrier protein